MLESSTASLQPEQRIALTHDTLCLCCATKDIHVRFGYVDVGLKDALLQNGSPSAAFTDFPYHEVHGYSFLSL